MPVYFWNTNYLLIIYIFAIFLDFKMQKMMLNNLNTEKIRMILICLVCLAAFFVNNRVITPDIMESRNIITAREMVYEGHWLVPTMNGELRLEKPPLPTWLTAIAEIVSPDNLALQRGIAGLAALLLVFYFWKFARHVLRLDPFVPTLLLCTCYNVILMGRTASWDIYCHAFMMGGIYHLARALGSPQPGAWRHFLVAGVFTGLSILSKGPVSLYALFLPFLISYGCVYRPTVKGKGFAIGVMAIVAIVLGTWWYVYVHLTETEAFSAIVQKESGSWMNHNVRPWWYYWKFFLETGVWSLLLPTAMFLPLASKRRRKSHRWLFSIVWMLASLVLLSLMPEKKSRYLLPLLIPASFVMGCLMVWWRKSLQDRHSASIADKWCFRINAGLVAGVVVALPVLAGWFLLRAGYVSTGGWAVFSLFAAAVAVYLLRATVRLRPMGLLGGVTLLFFAAECFVMPTLGNIINNPDIKSIAGTRGIKELQDVPFCHIDTVPLRIELVYAAHRTIRPVNADSLRANLPCALLTHRPIRETLPESCLEGIETVPIDRYDDNRRPKTNRRYSNNFIYYVTLLKAKGTADEPRQKNR